MLKLWKRRVEWWVEIKICFLFELEWRHCIVLLIFKKKIRSYSIGMQIFLFVREKISFIFENETLVQIMIRPFLKNPNMGNGFPFIFERIAYAMLQQKMETDREIFF